MSRCDNCLRDESEVELHVSCLECLEGTSKEEQPPPEPAKAELPDGYYFVEITNGVTLRHANGNIQPYIDCDERLRAFEALCAAYRAQQKKG